MTSTSERLYTPLFRVIFREIRSLIPPKGTIVTIANIPRSRHTQGLDFEVPLKFLPRYVRIMHVRIFLNVRYSIFTLFSVDERCNVLLQLALQNFIVSSTLHRVRIQYMLVYNSEVKSSRVK